MNEKQDLLLQNLAANIARLKKLYEVEVTRNKDLQEKIEQRTAELTRVEKENLVLKVKCNNLTDAAVLSATEEQRQDTIKRLSQMMREIDRCLALIK